MTLLTTEEERETFWRHRDMAISGVSYGAILSDLRTALARVAELEAAAVRERFDIEQPLAEALGYPKQADVPELRAEGPSGELRYTGGYCAAELAVLVKARVAELESENERLKADLDEAEKHARASLKADIDSLLAMTPAPTTAAPGTEAPVPCVCGNQIPSVCWFGNAFAQAWCVMCRVCKREGEPRDTRAAALADWATRVQGEKQ